MESTNRSWNRKAIIALAAIVPFALIFVLVSALAAPGDLDPSFDDDGIVITNIPSGGEDLAAGITVQPDGKIIAAGYSGDFSRVFAMTRYNPDGTLDDTFDNDGIVTTTMAVTISTSANSVLLQTDGKIILAGDGGVFNLARYHDNGSLDATFNGDGRAKAHFPGWAGAFGADIHQNGMIVAAGAEGIGTGSNAAVARFTITGTLDTGFNGDGIRSFNINSGDDQFEDVVVHKNNKILLAGWTDNGSDLDILLIRLQSDGDLDPSFGSDGVITTSLGIGHDKAMAAVVQDDNKILVGGSTNTSGDLDFLLLRYNNNGTLDSTFGVGGVVTTALTSDSDQIFDLALQADGKIVAVGDSHDGADDQVTVARYNTDGSLDQSFGTGGIIFTTVGDGSSGGRGVDLQPNGQIVAAGYAYENSSSAFAVLRYIGDVRPIADAGEDQTVTAGVTVTLDGSGSTDPEGNLPLEYMWDQIGGGPVFLSDVQVVSPTFTAPAGPNVLTFTLIVTNSLGHSSELDQVVVTVDSPAENQRPIAAAGSNQTVTAGDLVSLDGSGSSDPDGDLPLAFEWDQSGGVQVNLSDTKIATPTFTAPAGPDVLTFTLTVTDSLGLNSDPDQVVVTVEPLVENVKPIASAGPDQDAVVNDFITLDGTGSSDPDGNLPLAYKWDQTGGLAVSLSNDLAASPTFTAPSSPSELTFSLVVTDSLDLSSTPDEVKIFVDQHKIYMPIVFKAP